MTTVVMAMTRKTGVVMAMTRKTGVAILRKSTVVMDMTRWLARQTGLNEEQHIHFSIIHGQTRFGNRFLWVLQFPLLIELTATKRLKYC
jgi:hypothetical protein